MTPRQKLFNYFSENHNIQLLDSDFHEIDIILEGYAASKEEKTADSDEDLFCPFCKEKGFDKIGLKKHMNMYCHIYPIIFDLKY